jgi:hypothetical protein
MVIKEERIVALVKAVIANTNVAIIRNIPIFLKKYTLILSKSIGDLG